MILIVPKQATRNAIASNALSAARSCTGNEKSLTRTRTPNGKSSVPPVSTVRITQNAISPPRPWKLATVPSLNRKLRQNQRQTVANAHVTGMTRSVETSTSSTPTSTSSTVPPNPRCATWWGSSNRYLQRGQDRKPSSRLTPQPGHRTEPKGTTIQLRTEPRVRFAIDEPYRGSTETWTQRRRECAERAISVNNALLKIPFLLP